MKKLINYEGNEKIMKELKENIAEVAPFFGAGASHTYGYPLWKELLVRLLEVSFLSGDMAEKDKREIETFINKNEYMRVADALEKKSNQQLRKDVCFIMNDFVKKARPISIGRNGSWNEHLHKLPSQTYLTTNYDSVIENILKLNSVKNLKSATPIDFSGQTGLKPPIIYHLHGIYTNPDTIILSSFDYDEFYGIERRNVILRQTFAKRLYELFVKYSFLFIGCSINITEDRIFRLLKKLIINMPQSKHHYALLDENEEKNKNKYTRMCELSRLNIKPIWYSSRNTKHEEAINELFEYLLGDLQITFRGKRNT